METVVNKYQEMAFDLYLSEWPRDWDYDEVIEAVRGEMDAYIEVWQPLAHWRGEAVAQEIEDTIAMLKLRFEPRKVPA